jgi:hypothetical protein
MESKHFVTTRPISRTGAEAGSVLVGVIRSNSGLRIRVRDRQPKGEWGPVKGPFEILDPGLNMHTAALTLLVGQTLDAAQVLEAIRHAHPMCVNVVNANVVAKERA